MNRRSLSHLLCISALGGGMLYAQAPSATNNTTNPAPTETQSADTSSALAQLRARIAEQQAQIKKLQQAVDEQQQMLEKSLAAVSAATPAASSAPALVNTAAVEPVRLVPAVNTNKPDIVQAPRYWQHDELHTSPLSLGIGNTTFTPLGFVDATFFARSTAVGSGIGTNFGGIPLNTALNSHLSETNFTAQNSRLGMRVDSNYKNAKILGYIESDFLFNNNQAGGYQITSNSAGFRLRAFFVDVKLSQFEFLAGQDWSMATPNRVGLDPVPDNIFYSKNEDTNYQVGLIWARQPQFRFIYHANDNFAIGLSFENPQQYVGGGSGASAIVLPTALSSNIATELNNGANSNSTNVPNWFPDMVLKAAYDGHASSRLYHLEAGGLLSGFKDYVTLTTGPAVSGTHTAIGGSGFVNTNLELFKNFHLIANTFFGDGGGRYMFGLAPDFIVRQDGSISPVHSYSTVDGFEVQVTKKTLFSVLYGGAYIGRNVTYDTTGTKHGYVGYGQTGVTQNRNVQEITFDWTQTFWKHPSYGSLALINQYSYVVRDPWAIVGAGPKSGHTNLIYVDVRYTLP